jgi:hypothetical protein
MPRKRFPPTVADLMDGARSDLADWVSGEGGAPHIDKDAIKEKIERLALEAPPHGARARLRMALEEEMLATETPPAVYAVSAEEAIRLLIAQVVEGDLWDYWRELRAPARETSAVTDGDHILD